LALVAAPRAAACTCVSDPGSGPAWPTLEESIDKAHVAVVARVIAQGSAPKGQGAAYLDVKVVESFKGPSEGTTIRVWDIMVGSSCSLELGRFASGSIVAFALERSQPLNPELQKILGLAVRPGDYSLGVCGEYLRKMDSEAVARTWATRVRQRGKDSK